MKNKESHIAPPPDPTAEQRKQDHIELAFQSQIRQTDPRFYYEPMLAAHPSVDDDMPTTFGEKMLRYPIWVSSMTGGTAMARHINHHLARVCADFGLGMGLGSCRSLLFEDTYLPDFDVRDVIGEDQPLFANLGIAQVEHLLLDRKAEVIRTLVDKLRADGLIIHVNPLQEFLQPEGDRFQRSPLEVIEEVLEKVKVPLIIKEVGQGIGPASMERLLQLPLVAVEFAASGGTNFALLEMLRGDEVRRDAYEPLAYVGHKAAEMVEFVNDIVDELGEKRRCEQLILSGGVPNFLEGYYLIEKIALPSIYGQASGFLKHARGEYEALYHHVSNQVEGLKMAKAYLRVKK